MIKIKSLLVENLRGLKQLSLPINCNNFGIYGPNGTGKSGIVDALEFGLTGNITRLTGEGAGVVSITKHGPHVDERNNPEKAKVTLEVYIPSLKKSATITRCIKNSTKAFITPSDPEIEAIIQNYSEHPEFALSRREILKYILTPPSKRSEQVQSLLKLETLRKIQALLKKIENTCSADITKFYEPEQNRTENELMQSLGIQKLNREAILEEINQRRTFLNLSPLIELNKDTTFDAGLNARAATLKPQINQADIVLQINALENLLAELNSDNFKQVISEQIKNLEIIENNPSLLNNLKKEFFLKTGFDLIDEASCPLCENEWEIDKLKEHLAKRIQEIETAKTFKIQLENKNVTISSTVNRLILLLKQISASITQLDVSLGASDINVWVQTLQSLEASLHHLDKIAEIKSLLTTDWYLATELVSVTLVKVKEKLAQTNSTDTEGRAIAFLTLTQERFSKYQAARRELANWQNKQKICKQVLDIYNQCYESSLQKIYESIQSDFARFYQIINSNDEDNFSAELASSPGKLDLNVDFYNRGKYPPNAYHSEGHQDGMGLCLYLALMKHIAGDNFTFCVLDDVLMSVDISHRKEVCKLLKTEFPNTQFVFTTHDEIWLRHMIAEALITKKSAIRFLNWSVEYGPQYLTHLDSWEEINKEIQNNDTSTAAFKLRRLLEYIFYDLATRLRAKVEMRDNNSYDLGELYDATLFAWGDLLDKARKSAISWGQSDKVSEIDLFINNKKSCTQKINRERWLINPLVHYNPWAKFDRNELLSVVIAFKDLIQCYKCGECDSFIYLTPVKGESEQIRCDCSSISLNLKYK